MLDSEPVEAVQLASASAVELRAAGVPAATARRLVAARRRRTLRSFDDLARLDLPRAGLERLRRVGLLDEDDRLIVTDVQPAEGRVMSDVPFALRVSFQAAATARPALAKLEVSWAGEPFVVERLVSAADARRGYIDVKIAPGLPAGTARFAVDLFSEAGAQSSFRLTCAVLPSNPLSVHLSPNAHFLTGTAGARGVREGGGYTTAISVTVLNGDSAAVSLTGGYRWRFWDGGVGGSLVEEGTGSFGAIRVAAHDSWGGWITFTSPPGSGVYNKYDGREDMTLEIVMDRVGGGSVSDTIACRTMFRFGINVIRVDAEVWTDQERQDLIDASLGTRSIYEHRNVTHDISRQLIEHARAGDFGVINSESEARDLFAQWRGPGQNIDVFVVHDIVGTTFDGLAGAIPGPTSHDGRNSGVVVSKSGFVDGAGRRRLHVAYLAMLIGHEVGHYLGLSHVNEAGNLMLSSSSETDTQLNYDPQYRTIIRFGWMRID